VDDAPANLAEIKPQPDEDAVDSAVAANEGLAVIEQEITSAKRFLSEKLASELWRKADAGPADLSEPEFAEALEFIGTKENFGLDAGVQATPGGREAFWRSLHLEELAIARGCALGREAAWQRFVAQYREPLTRAAVGITGDLVAGEELANTLYSELFGLTERDGKRWSPLIRYSGRGSLMGWLRAVLAQRRVNLYRRTNRETALDDIEPAAPVSESPEPEKLEQLRLALQKVLVAIPAEERFLLSAYYLDRHTLQEVSRVLGVHEATVSRKLKRTTDHLGKELRRALVLQGLSRRAAEEALGADPRDIDINLRKLLQKPERRSISNQEGRE
jgi:RNA polymerase sigma-70 factor (ECF subfamily)